MTESLTTTQTALLALDIVKNRLERRMTMQFITTQIHETIEQLLKAIRLNRSNPLARSDVRLAIRRTRQLRGILEARDMNDDRN